MEEEREEEGGKGSGEDDDCIGGDNEEGKEEIRFPFKLVCIRGFKAAAFSITS